MIISDKSIAKMGAIFLLLASLFFYFVFTQTKEVKSYWEPALYVDGLNNWSLAWDTESGTSPFLGDNTDYIHEAKTAGVWEGNFSFADGSISGSVTGVTLWMQCYQDDNDETIVVMIWDSGDSNWVNAGTITPPTASYNWESLNLDSILTTWDEVNNAEMAVQYVKGGGGDDLGVMRVYLNVSWGDVTSPTYTNQGENQTNTSTIRLGEAVKVYAQWNDGVQLDKWWFYNGTHNMTASSFSSGNWSNTTWNTTGLTRGTTYTLKFYANDTSNNDAKTGAWQYTIESICSVSFTLSSQLTDGIRFGNLDPGQSDQAAVDNGDYNVTDTSSGCNYIAVYVKAWNDLEDTNSIGIGNVSIANNSNVGNSIQLSQSYQMIKNVSASSLVELYFWIDIPTNHPLDYYNTTISIKANQSI